MRKETINTFSDGMSLDLNPLGTPAKTLTNCLNGTLVTYNGNELTLQNDMGNVEVGTAALPKGYVPVGMKEYGGIIYVASYNPETKKGQLGCFPSPQQIYVSEAAQTVLDINLEKSFLIEEKFWNKIPIIDKNEYKEEIFKDFTTQEAKIFNTGDKFIIKTDSPFSDVLREAIDNNIVVIKLFIIPTNGEKPIDISSCEKQDLRLYQEVNSQWQKSLWIFQNDGNRYIDSTEDQSNGEVLIEKRLPFETILSTYREFLQVYPGPQGTLEIVFEFNTFKLFNLYRKYQQVGSNFNVQFIGEAFADDTDPCNIVNQRHLEPLVLSGNINRIQHNIKNCSIISTQSNQLVAYTDNQSISGNETLYYDIMPTSKYGALKLFNNSFLKSGELTNSGILAAHNKITNWDFEIDTDAITLKWTYTTFTSDPEIDHMRIVLIPLDTIKNKTKDQIDQFYITGNNTPTDNPNIYKVHKLLYSGDFEDRIEFVDQHIEHNYIYLCRLDIIYNNGNVINGQEYKLLYTGTFFNNKDVQQFNYTNRPQVEITPELQVEQSYIIKSFNYITLLEDENGKIQESEPKEIVTANDVMFLADHDKYYNKIIGIILNAECEITSTLSVNCDRFVKYGDEETEMHPYYAGNFNSEQTLDACSQSGKIICTVKDETKYIYEGDGDEQTVKELQDRVEQASLVTGSGEVNLDGATIVYTKNGNTYQNTSTIKIHRGIISRLGQEDFYEVCLEGLFPVYDPDDTLYNEKLFGFQIEDDGSLSNIIGGENFIGLSMWLAKNRALNASTSVKDSMLTVERTYSSKTGLSRYDFKGNAGTPYHYGSYISEGVGIVNYGSEGTSRIESMEKSNYAPIQIIASNEYERVWDKSYWDGRVDGRICNLMVLPHSEFGENLRKEFDTAIDEDGYSEGVPLGTEKHYGRIAIQIRNSYISGVKDNVGDRKRNLFKVSKGNSRGMYILWRSQYGYQIMNIATPIDIESNQTPTELITVQPSGKKLNVSWDTNGGKNKTYPASETHLRADHMLICLLSQILITKKRNTSLLLNAPNIAQIYQTLSFKTKGLLTINNNTNPVITLNGENIEVLLKILLQNNILDESDIFIPEFYVQKYSNGYIDCGGKITNSTDRFGLVNLEDLFYAEGTPEFSTVTAEQRLNIYPGIINKVLGMYLCQLKKDKLGLYQINTDLVDQNDKFYKVFLPTIHSHTNKEGAKYSFKNTNTYKQILEGFAYNDVLFPLTRVLKEQGHEVSALNSQEDVEQPFFNLLYYNSIDLKFEMEPSNDKQFVMHGVDCGCPVPVDYCHGFAFITLFGDQSRYLDASVYARNVLNYTTFSSVDFNLGYTNSHDIDGKYRCNCYDVFGKNRRSFVWRTLPSGSNQFKLGTEDWSTSKVTQAWGQRELNVSDTAEEVTNAKDKN